MGLDSPGCNSCSAQLPITAKMPSQYLITRAHSFPQPAEFRAEPRNLGFSRGFLSRGI